MFSTKAQTLKKLEGQLSLFVIPKTISFTVVEWYANQFIVLENIVNYFKSEKLIVRSSAIDEDEASTSQAGKYVSVLGIDSHDLSAIHSAIETVIASYQRQRTVSDLDQILVQEMIQNSSMSGVIFTHDLNTGAPYYVINYDDVSGLTNTVTSGAGEYSNRTLYVHRSKQNLLRSQRFRSLIDAVYELECIMQSQFLDIEFALGNDLTPYLFQVRAITTRTECDNIFSHHINKSLHGIQYFMRERLKKKADIFGDFTVLGQMPDWNPAEMIGRAPRALAYSLYQTLITDHAWRIARKSMNYKVPNGQPLMVSLAGQPFIDTRLSFHSFLPEGLSNNICDKLVNAWLYRLKKFPELHDKIEFDVAITTYSFDFDAKVKKLIPEVLNVRELAEYKKILKSQTIQLISGVSSGSIKCAMDKISNLSRMHEANVKESNNDISHLNALIDNCINLGTIPFAILARHGFIARTLLLSLVYEGVLDLDRAELWQSGIRTVASGFVEDMENLQKSLLHRSDFMLKYGHLRPGTYDILSRRYDQMPDIGHHDIKSPITHKQDVIALSALEKNKINEILIKHGFYDLNSDDLLDYIKSAVVGREYSKFVFTRSVSDILELIAEFGKGFGLTREYMSHVPLHQFLRIVGGSHESDIRTVLCKIAEDEAEKHRVSIAIRLPQIIYDEAGVHIVPFQVSHPNFITQGKITAPIRYLAASDGTADLTGCLVLIENADPGFDWIFAHAVAGLITKYGGSNSHMAIRCAEFDIPAAIGCGEQRFELLLKMRVVQLDCAAGLIIPVH